jgi:single-strand DNA-binding protein
MASRSVNKVILLGRLGKDAETKFTAQGTAVTSFTLATSRRWKDQQTNDWREETEWHNIKLWRGENVSPYLTKGKQVYLEGRISTRQYEDKDGQKKYFTEITCEDLILVGGGRDGGGDEMGGGAEYSGGGPVSMPRSAQRQARPAAPSGGGSQDFDPGISDDDVPF